MAITSQDVTRLTLVYSVQWDNFKDRQTVMLDRAENAFPFTARDIVLGLGSLIDRWKSLVRNLLHSPKDYFSCHGQSHPIVVHGPRLLKYKHGGHVTLHFDIDGIYES